MFLTTLEEVSTDDLSAVAGGQCATGMPASAKAAITAYYAKGPDSQYHMDYDDHHYWDPTLGKLNIQTTSSKPGVWGYRVTVGVGPGRPDGLEDDTGTVNSAGVVTSSGY
jgi:hypothetical protein